MTTFIYQAYKQNWSGKTTNTNFRVHGFSYTPSQLFKYSGKTNKVELAKMISMKHLSFNFGEKVEFVNYCQNALNSCAKRIPRNTLKRTLYKLYSKEKNNCIKYF